MNKKKLSYLNYTTNGNLMSFAHFYFNYAHFYNNSMLIISLQM